MAWEGRRVGAGTFGKVFVDGEEMFDIKQYEAKISIDKEDVIQNGTRSKDTKQVTAGGEGSFVVHKVYSRGAALMNQYKAGEEVGWENVVFKLEDKDMTGVETIEIKRISFDEIPLFSGENASLMEQEFAFTFNPDNVKYKDVIERPSF